MKKIIAIIQARMNSSRLPGKVLMDISGKPMLERVINRVKRVKTANQVILAIPDNQDEDVLEQFAKERSIDYFRGNEENVLQRYYRAAKHFNCDVIIRITADCPLIDKDIIDLVVSEHLELNNDFTSNMLESTFPLGMAVEVMNFESLKKASENATEDYQKEHVTPYIIKHADKKSNIRAEISLTRSKIRLTVDEQEDLDLVRRIYQRFKSQEYFSLKEIISFLDDNPGLLDINKSVKQTTVNYD